MTRGAGGRLRVGVIGCGFIGATGHLPAFARGRRGGAVHARRRRRPRYRSGRAGGAAVRGAGLWLGPRAAGRGPARRGQHRHHALDAPRPGAGGAAAGCHVLCEKPVAMNAGEPPRWWPEPSGPAACSPSASSTAPGTRRATSGSGSPPATWATSPPCAPGRRGAQLPHQPGPVPPAGAGGGVLSHWTVHNLDLALWLLGGPEPLTASAFCAQRLTRLSPARCGAWPRAPRRGGRRGGRSGDRGPGRGPDPAGRGHRPHRRGGLVAAPLGPQRGVGAGGDRGRRRSRPSGCGSTAASGWTRRPRRGRWPPATTT